MIATLSMGLPLPENKKDYKLAMKRGLNIRLLEDVIATLSMGLPLPEKTETMP